MGQYYIPVIVLGNKIKKAFYSHAYGNGLKLMEHSYIGNNFVNAVLHEIFEGPLGAQRLVWLGDYADYFVEQSKIGIEYAPGIINTNPDIEHILSEADFEELMKVHEADTKTDTIFVHNKNEKTAQLPPAHRYVVNFDKHEYIDLAEWTKVMDKEYPSHGWVVHPIPLLCSVGNRNGGGDYRGADDEACGRWAYDRIGVFDELPSGLAEFAQPFEDVTFCWVFHE